MEQSLKIILILCCLYPTLMVAQKHDYNWVLGYGYENLNQPINSKYGNFIMDFNKKPMECRKLNLKVNFSLTAASCSDSTGKLLFYTNGHTIRTASGGMMENGDSLNFGYFWTNDPFDYYTSIIGGFALPFPDHPNQYFYFHEGWEFDLDSNYVRQNPFYLTKIDMNQNGGKGKVIQKNQVLMQGDLSEPVACKHGNGRDWWITMYDLSDAAQQTWLLSPDGLTGPFIQHIGPGFAIHEWACKSIFSPDGRTYLRHDGKNGIRLMDFDRCNGLFSNMRILPYPTTIFSWSAAFSLDSRYLYISKLRTVWRLDLQAQDLSASFDTLSLFNYSACPYFPWDTRMNNMQIGPDGKIYGCHLNKSMCDNRISQPNLPGLAADMGWGSLEFPRWNDSSISQFPDYRLGEFQNSPCDTINFQKPGDGFFSTMHELKSSPVDKKTADDYTILPMLKNPGLLDTNEEAPQSPTMQNWEKYQQKEKARKKTITPQSIQQTNPTRYE